jgi:hypothetical protein
MKQAKIIFLACLYFQLKMLIELDRYIFGTPQKRKTK